MGEKLFFFRGKLVKVVWSKLAVGQNLQIYEIIRIVLAHS